MTSRRAKGACPPPHRREAPGSPLLAPEHRQGGAGGFQLLTLKGLAPRGGWGAPPRGKAGCFGQRGVPSLLSSPPSPRPSPWGCGYVARRALQKPQYGRGGGRVTDKGTYFSSPDSQGPCLRKPKEHPLEVPATSTSLSLPLQGPTKGSLGSSGK